MAASTILKPYERRKDLGPVRRFFAFALLFGVAVFYGLMAAVLPMQLVSFPLVPILFLIVIILWMLPDVGGVRQDQMQTLMLAYIGFGVVWPNYVALDVPGLPWITPTRVAVFSLLAVVVMNFSTSREFRDRLKDAIAEPKALMVIFWLFWAATTVSLVLSNSPVASLNKYANNQIFWTMMFPLAAMLATRAGFVMTLSRILLIGTVIVMVAGIYEYRIQRVFWLDHLPAFLKVDPEYLARVLKSQARAGTDIYRVRGTFATSLYFSEFLTMVFPLFLHFTVKERRILPFLALLAALLGMLVVMYLTNARSAMVGILVTSILYLLYTALRQRTIHTRSIAGTATLLAYPAAVVTLALVVQFWHRAHVMVLGGGQHQTSSDARSAQWTMGWPKILSHPFGYGVGRGGEALGYYNLAGEITVDSHYLTIMLDSGLLALPLFLGCFLIPALMGFVYFRDSMTPEQQLLAPLSLGLINFVIVKSVLTSEGSVPLAFVMAGCIVGLVWQRRHADVAAKISGTAVAVPARGMTPGFARQA